jgi:hypothetical protein
MEPWWAVDSHNGGAKNGTNFDEELYDEKSDLDPL